MQSILSSVQASMNASSTSSSNGNTVINVTSNEGRLPSCESTAAEDLNKLRQDYKHYVLVLEDLNSQRKKSQRVEPQGIRLCFKQHLLDHIALDLLGKEETEDMTNADLLTWIESRVDARNEQLTFRVSDSTKKLAAVIAMDTSKEFLEDRVNSVQISLRKQLDHLGLNSLMDSQAGRKEIVSIVVDTMKPLTLSNNLAEWVRANKKERESNVKALFMEARELAKAMVRVGGHPPTAAIETCATLRAKKADFKLLKDRKKTVELEAKRDKVTVQQAKINTDQSGGKRQRDLPSSSSSSSGENKCWNCGSVSQARRSARSWSSRTGAVMVVA